MHANFADAFAIVDSSRTDRRERSALTLTSAPPGWPSASTSATTPGALTGFDRLVYSTSTMQ